MSLTSEVRDSKELLYNLTMREVRGKYKRSVLGQTWSLINPVATLTIYTLVFGIVLKATPPPGNPSGVDVFAVWLACALLPWNFFNNTVVGGMGALIGNGNLIQKVYFPRWTLVVASMLASLVTFGFELLVLLVACVLFGSDPWVWLPGVLVVVALLGVFGLGLALALSIANVYFRDTAQFVSIFLQILFYATPILYSVTLVEARAKDHPGIPLLTLYRLNPMERFSVVIRNFLYDNRMPALADLAYCVGAAAVSLAFGIWVFRKFQARIAEEL
jgi:ABC-type polysaccharide/polyol phosphate export permease